jgi:hypothetical protein
LVSSAKLLEDALRTEKNVDVRERLHFRYIHATSPILYIAIVHYTRIAISGDRRDAFQAGKSPANMVTVSDISHT